MSAADSSSHDSGGGRQFATTSWSLILQAAAPSDSPPARLALEEMCRSYWYPLYAYVRRQGHDAEQARDLTQGFFAHLLEGRLLEKADAQRGRFRAFLLTALRNFIANQARDQRAEKRGGGQPIFRLDYEGADLRFQQEPAVHDDPLQYFETQWALNLLELAFDAVRSQYEEQGKLAQFNALQPYLNPNRSAPLADVAQTLGMQVGAVKVALHRLRQRYGQQLRLQIAKTVDDPGQVDDELRALFRAFSKVTR